MRHAMNELPSSDQLMNMKTLYLIRHAKAANNIQPDIDRPLAERGYADAYKMAYRLLEKNIVPELVISSPATRALNTALIFSRVLKYKAENVLLNQNLYFSSVEEYLSVINTIDEEINCAFVFGHNDTMHETVNYFLQNRLEDFPTCSVAALELQADNWQNIYGLKANLLMHWHPKMWQD